MAVNATEQRAQKAGEAKVLRLASECGLLGPLGATAPDEWTQGTAGTGQAALLDTLRVRVRRRVRELWDHGRLGTALTHFKKFLEATGRVPFRQVERAGDIASMVYNQETLEIFAECGSARRAARRRTRSPGTSR